MLTDTCGNGSTGYLANIPAMNAKVPTVAQQLPSPYFGKLFGGNPTSCWGVVPSNVISVDFTKGFSMFAYFYVTSNSAVFPFMEFDYVDANIGLINYGPIFWLYGGGLHYNIGSSSGKTRIE